MAGLKPLEETQAVCFTCRKPLGEGSLLDYKPLPPVKNMSLKSWRAFAGRYRCPACAQARQSQHEH
jgi:hypothetical protein